MPQGAHVGGNEPKLIDSSAPLFSMYNEKAKERDEKMAESWKGDAEGILVFTGLFSAAVAQLLGSSLQNLQLNPQDASNFYLARIYQLTPGSNASSIHLPDDPDSFNPPKIAIWVNILWSLSLVISLTCALLATLLQQWSRRYLHMTQKRNDPRKRAQIRQLMRQALKEGFRLRWMVELLPTLLHISVFLFLVGFVAYLSTFNHLVAKLAGACAISSSALYVYISLAPIYSPGSLYSTPLTTIIWVIFMGIGSILIRLYHFVAVRWLRPRNPRRIRELYQLYYQRVRKRLTKGVEELADTHPSLSTSVLLSTYDFIDGDSDMEQFLSAIPGFYSSTQTKPGLTGEDFKRFNSEPLPSLIMSYMDHVLSSNLLRDPERQNHIEICSRTIKANSLLLESTFRQTLRTLNFDSDVFTHTSFVDLALEQLRGDSDHPGTFVKDYAQCILAVAINRTRLDNSAWTDIVSRYLRPQHAQYREGHNLRLCNLIYLTQQLKDSQLEISDRFASGEDWYIAFVAARNLEVSSTAPELQEDFRALWDELGGMTNNLQRSVQTRENARTIRDLLYPVYVLIP